MKRHLSETESKEEEILAQRWEDSEKVRKGQQMLANWIYECGISFNSTKHPLFRQFVAFLAPGFQVPSPQFISSKLLDNRFEQIQSQVNDVCDYVLFCFHFVFFFFSIVLVSNCLVVLL